MSDIAAPLPRPRLRLNEERLWTAAPMGRAWVHKEADDRRWQLPPKFVLRDNDEKERVIQLCLLLDPKMIDIPFDSWDEQEAFELVLTFDDIGRRVLGVPIPPDNR